VQMTLYHGTNDKHVKLTKDSCFTDKLLTAKDYALYWVDQYGGKPCILEVKGDFTAVGGPDEFKLTDPLRPPMVLRVIEVKK